MTCLWPKGGKTVRFGHPFALKGGFSARFRRPLGLKAPSSTPELPALELKGALAEWNLEHLAEYSFERQWFTRKKLFFAVFSGRFFNAKMQRDKGAEVWRSI